MGAETQRKHPPSRVGWQAPAVPALQAEAEGRQGQAQSGQLSETVSNYSVPQNNFGQKHFREAPRFVTISLQ